MGIKKIEKFFDENGIEMQKDTYDNGTIVVHGANSPEPIPEREPLLTEQEQIAIDTALNVEYIACLLEASLT